ncbi:Dienelactone hydrolase [Methylobacterium phyllostachyos]|uniref:Dienelactone hydrolase n=1 Tax=Methylobacterium phyllostachyos TaxID=582672 RepID=A0A1H0DBS1_9HYPH|nr:dienelactone hydrolase family protein [Methylobacterium phyllostachyos]SDN67585.1 Dienelactone hydrolase [Methylobacterium phyllostachyos]
MRFTRSLTLALTICFPATAAEARASRDHLTVPTSNGGTLVESFGTCAEPTCPVVLILSGSKGFGTPAYDELGWAFRKAGLNAYLVHILSVDDLNAIASASGATARIAYYARRLPDWVSSVREVASYLAAQPHSGRVGVLGVSLGAQTASAASVGRSDIDALVLVDGGFPNSFAQPVRSLPPLLLIWGSADKTFPLSVGRELKQTAERLGRFVSLDVYQGGSHDFFLKAATQSARDAHQSAADFLKARLAQ